MVNDVDPVRLRRLAAFKPKGCRVLSIYLDLDPSQFATSEARKSEVTSALDAAGRMVEEAGLDHDALVAARADVERARATLVEDGIDAKGAQALALFACGPGELFEILKLPRPVATQVTIDDSPWIEPLVQVAGEPRIAVALVDRHNLRLLHGSAAELEELDPDSVELREPRDAGHVHERRHRTANDDEVNAHLHRSAYVLLALLKTRGYDALILAPRHELRGALLDTLHPYVRDRVVGEIEVDVSSATVDAIRREAAELCAKVHERKVTESLERLRERLGRGTRAAAGLADVLAALNERRVETLLYERNRPQSGVVCPQDGWLGTGTDECPIDGTPVDKRDNILENAAETAVLQDADVLAIDPYEHPELGPHGGVGAILRF
jgi:peptide subunit release factor 1 (eRF1)